ncbi:MAG: 4-alpha-glucanotransferase [Spongiibacteraceae bacterium]
MSDDRLYILAQRAGLILRWTDYLGSERTVDADVLRQVLNALQLPADHAAAIDESLERLDVAELLTLPEMIVGRNDRPTLLPLALQARAQQTLRLHLEHGPAIDVTTAVDALGRVVLPCVPQPGYHRLEAGGAMLTLAMAPVRGFTMADLGAVDLGTGDLAVDFKVQRRWGLSAQLYGLRRDQDFGVGDCAALGELARIAAAKGADALAISPTHALFSADPSHFSPYSPSSRLFLNALHIDVDDIVSEQALQAWIAELGLGEELSRLRNLELIDWPAVARTKLQVLRKIWSQLGPRWVDSEHVLAKSFRAFRQQGGIALEDHARFEALHAEMFAHDAKLWHWRNWPVAFRDPHGDAVANFAAQHVDAVNFHVFLQWLAAKGFSAAQRHARDAGMAIGLIADLAVGTADGGSHVWSQQQDFLMGLAVGAPPDAINTHGQNWGLTTFSPMALRTRSYAPFIDILRAALRHSGGLRIDHILAIRRLWVTPDGVSATAGVYLSYPEQDLLNLIALESARHKAIAIGEDLGTVPPGFSAMLSEAGLLGMQVLWFQRDQSFFIEPARWSSHALATTSTHDLPTVAGWWRGRDIEWHEKIGMLPPDSTIDDQQLHRAHDRHMLWGALTYAGVEEGAQPADSDTEIVVDAALQFVASTPAPLAIFPLEDICGAIEQPNVPGTVAQHPNWRRRLPEPATAALSRLEVEARLAGLRRIRGMPDN